jgi:hypothetical protein
MQIWIAENDYEVWILGEHLFEGPYYYWSHYQECKAARYDAELMRKAIRKYYKSQMGERSASKDLFLIDLFRRVDDMFIQETPIDETTNQIQILLQFSKLYCSVDKK